MVCQTLYNILLAWTNPMIDVSTVLVWEANEKITSFVFCRLRVVTTLRQLPPGLVSAVSSSTCGAPCLRACSPQLVEPGKKLLEEEKKTTLPEGVCKKVSRRGVDDQTFCWRGIEGALLRRMGTKPKNAFLCGISRVRL